MHCIRKRSLAAVLYDLCKTSQQRIDESKQITSISRDKPSSTKE
ncbi:unnamed protein product [Soboliphyme baturini]|uniref:Transposase n=1 Tax=Soboliphyme baturini TaxID=241478 RepID=A0A183IP95_9BILA|nr:unnamed protein product [Soboliphyme baturini]